MYSTILADMTIYEIYRSSVSSKAKSHSMLMRKEKKKPIAHISLTLESEWGIMQIHCNIKH